MPKLIFLVQLINIDEKVKISVEIDAFKMDGFPKIIWSKFFYTTSDNGKCTDYVNYKFIISIRYIYVHGNILSSEVSNKCYEK